MERVLYQPWRTHPTTSGSGAASGSALTVLSLNTMTIRTYLKRRQFQTNTQRVSASALEPSIMLRLLTTLGRGA